MFGVDLSILARCFLSFSGLLLLRGFGKVYIDLGSHKKATRGTIQSAYVQHGLFLSEDGILAMTILLNS